jgi:hypothetical protein
MPSKKPDTVDARLNNFAQQYSAHRNATRAAAAAGYSPASAAVQGSQLIRRPDVKALVAKFDADLTERTNISKDWVINETLRTYAHALDLDHTATARGCLHLLALLHGHIVEKRDVRVIRDVRDLSDAELASIAATTIEGDPPRRAGQRQVSLPPDLGRGTADVRPADGGAARECRVVRSTAQGCRSASLSRVAPELPLGGIYDAQWRSITGRGISIFRSPPKTFGPIGLARRSSAPGIGNSPTARQHAVVEVPLCADGLSYGVAQRRSCDVVF